MQLHDKLKLIANAFCPTGKGGGVDPTCSPNAENDGHLEDETAASVRKSTTAAFMNSWSEDPSVFVEYRHWAMTGHGQVNDDEFSAAIDKKLDKISRDDKPLSSDRVYRGEVGLTDEQVADMQPGSIISRPGWYSTSSDKKVAEAFTDLKEAEELAGQELPGKNRVVFEIYGTKGQHVVDLRKHKVNLDQQEILLPGKNTHLRVLYVEESRKGYKKVVAQLESKVHNSNRHTDNAFCPTGKGGGQDNSCSPKTNESFTVGKRIVFKNPTEGDLAFLRQEYTNKWGAATGPKIRSTIDSNGNKYSWMSDSTHADIEPAIERRFGVKVDQNGYFDPKDPIITHSACDHAHNSNGHVYNSSSQKKQPHRTFNKKPVQRKLSNKKSPTRVDPTRLATLRRVWITDLKRRFKSIDKALYQLLVVDDAFGLEGKKVFNQSLLENYDVVKEIARAAKETDTNPSEAQRKAGTYRKGKVWVQGLEVAIESPRGSTRSGIGADGKPWSTTMKHHYGYIKLTESEADGDHIDCFLGPNPTSDKVFVIDQTKGSDFKEFDEHKCMIGWDNAEDAKQAYHDNFSEGWQGFSGITEMTMQEFKQWLKEGDSSKPVMNSFCPTGEGGGVDPSCSPGSKAVTKTPEFKKWFKDSKVVDEKGEPLVVYHGSPSLIEEFKPTPSKRTMGFLGAQREVISPASFFSESIYMARSFGDSRSEPGKNTNITKAYLSIKNPIDLTGNRRIVLRQLKLAGIDTRETKQNMWEILDVSENIAKLQSAGYDGAKLSDAKAAKEFGRNVTYPVPNPFKDPKASTTWAVFSSTQIKSATGNRGTFDPNDKIITHSLNEKLQQLAKQRGTLVVNSSYFAECERDEKGRCLPSGEVGDKSSSEESKTPESGKEEISASKFDRAKWQGKREEWGKLPVGQRDNLADAENSVKSRVSELLKGVPERPNTGNLSKDLETRIGQLSDRVHPQAADRMKTVARDYTNLMTEAGVKPEHQHELAMEAVDHLAAQESETMARQLGDHGVAHIKGDIDVSMQTLNALPAKSTAQDKLAAYTACIYHDTGYLTEPSRSFLDEGHPRWSEQYYNTNIKPTVAKALGERAANEVSHIIRTHDATDMDWNNDSVASSVRLSDNLAVFHREKLPPVFRYVNGNIDVLKDLGAGKIDKATANERMVANIDKSNLSDKVKSQLRLGAKEVSEYTPKVTLGMLGGTLTGIKYKEGTVVAEVKESKKATEINKLGDFGQNQLAKLAKTFDADPKQFQKDLNFTFKGKDGRTRLRIEMQKAVENMLHNAFCPTGKGGGIDPSCSPNQGHINPTISESLKKLSYDQFDKHDPEKLKSALKRLSTDLGIQTNIRILNDADFNAKIAKQASRTGVSPSSVKMFYEKNNKEICIRHRSIQSISSSTDYRLFMNTVYHEIGHAYQFQTTKTTSGVHTSVSQYENAPTEDFADLFSSRIGMAVKKVSGGTVHGELSKRNDIHKYLEESLVNNQTLNAGERFHFQTSPEQVNSFRQWIAKILKQHLLDEEVSAEDQWFQQYVEEGYKKGAGRAFDDTRPAVKKWLQSEEANKKLDFYDGTRADFLRSSFARPVSVEKVKLLAGRSFTDLKGISDQMSARLTRGLTDGLVQGKNSKQIYKELAKDVGISESRARAIAQTELTRAHASGQIQSFKDLGVTRLGVMAEWKTADDDRVCDECSAMDGVVLKVDEAEGMIPRHPQCRCALLPANVGEEDDANNDQIRGKSAIEKAIEESLEVEGRGDKTTWPGADVEISKTRPQGIFNTEGLNDFPKENQWHRKKGSGTPKDINSREVLFNQQQEIIIDKLDQIIDLANNALSPKEDDVENSLLVDNRSFFAECERDEHGHCLTEGSSGSKSQLATRTYKPSTVEKQRKGEAEQLLLAKAIGGINTEDNQPFDIIKGKNGIEVKTIQDNNNDKITVHPESRIRKEKEAKKLNLKTHTVAIDTRAGRRVYYYSSGIGSFRISSMQQVSLAKLKTLLS